jgi:ABC-type Zn uptake system ZnuABC Zn-binding protein ZnuA
MDVRLHVSVLAVALSAVGCGTAEGDPGKLRVVTTVSPITNIAENVGGNRVEITGLVPEGTNSHEFEPAPADARVVAEADVIFVNGLNLELPTLDLAAATAPEGSPIVQLGNEIIPPDQYIFDFSFPEEEGDPNPHLWTNPPYAARYAEVIEDTLSELDPGNAEYYAQNSQSFSERIDELDRAVRAVTATVPEENRKLLTYHDSFPYFARQYGWEIVGAIQPSDFSDPTPQEVARLIEQVRTEDVPAIFGSEVFPSPVLEQIAAETGAEYVDDLRDDDLPGSPGDPEHSYLGLMVFDYRTFMGALGGDISPFDDVDTSNVADVRSAEYRE